MVTRFWNTKKWRKYFAVELNISDDITSGSQLVAWVCISTDRNWRKQWRTDFLQGDLTETGKWRTSIQENSQRVRVHLQPKSKQACFGHLEKSADFWRSSYCINRRMRALRSSFTIKVRFALYVLRFMRRKIRKRILTFTNGGNIVLFVALMALCIPQFAVSMTVFCSTTQATAPFSFGCQLTPENHGLLK